jgi:excisionase family DNA binding protein
LTDRVPTRQSDGGEDEYPARAFRELAMEQYMFNLSDASDEEAQTVAVKSNVWLLSSEEVPPILFTVDEVSRLLGIGRCRVYDLVRQRDLRSVKVGSSRRISARALHDYVSALEVGEPA